MGATQRNATFVFIYTVPRCDKEQRGLADVVGILLPGQDRGIKAVLALGQAWQGTPRIPRQALEHAQQRKEDERHDPLDPVLAVSAARQKGLLLMRCHHAGCNGCRVTSSWTGVW